MTDKSILSTCINIARLIAKKYITVGIINTAGLLIIDTKIERNIIRCAQKICRSTE